MSQPDSIEGIYEEKPKSNVYTAMLGLSFGALCLASAMLALELKDYQYDFKAQNAKAVVAPVTAPPSGS